MKRAPIQLGTISFRRIHVELDDGHPQGEDTPAREVSPDLDGVNIRTDVSVSPAGDAEGEDPAFFLVLRVRIDNTKPDAEDPRFSPYLIDVEAGAVVRVRPGAETPGNVEDLVLVNGTSVLWSAIREQVCSLSARMPAGAITLPTVHFLDLRQQNREASEQPEVPGAKQVRRASSKAAAAARPKG